MRHLPYHDLLEQFGRPGCALCALEARAVRSYLESLCGECVTDVDAREQWRKSFGLCPPHSAQLEGLAPRLTLAILYEDLLRLMDGELAAAAARRRRGAPPPCPACAMAAQQREGSLRALAQSINDPALAAAYRNSAGLCRSHTLELCARLRGADLQRVAAEERERLARLAAELREVQRKHDYRYSGEAWGAEKTSPARAVAKVAGEPPPPRET